MKSVLRPGILLGILVVLWTFIMGITGWYKHPTLLNLFWVVVVIQLAVLVWGLRQTAQEGKTYWGQVGAGTMMSLFGGVIIFLGSIVFTTVVFPEYFHELRALGEEMYRTQGLTEEAIRNRQELEAAVQTPFMQALLGFIGTVVTGLIGSMIIGGFIRGKGGSAPPANQAA